MITQYKFSEDEEMQSIGRELFQNGNHIAESFNDTGNRVLSFLIIEEGIYRVKNEQLMPKNASIVVYPEFDEQHDLLLGSSDNHLRFQLEFSLYHRNNCKYFRYPYT